jgi:hypothetical protein
LLENFCRHVKNLIGPKAESKRLSPDFVFSGRLNNNAFFAGRRQAFNIREIAIGKTTRSGSGVNLIVIVPLHKDTANRPGEIRRSDKSRESAHSIIYQRRGFLSL